MAQTKKKPVKADWIVFPLARCSLNISPRQAYAMHVSNPLSRDQETHEDTQTRHNRTVVQSIKIKKSLSHA